MLGWLAVAALAMPQAALAATCQADDEPMLLACIAGAASGDVVAIGTFLTLSGAPLVVNNDITITGFPLGGDLVKQGPGTMTLLSGNSFGGVSLEEGTIAVDNSASLSWGGQFHLRGGKLLSVNPGSILMSGGTLLFSAPGSTVAAPTGGTLTIQAGLQISNVVATIGEPANAGAVTIRTPGSAGVASVSSALHVAAGDFTFDSSASPLTVLPFLMNALQDVTIDSGATLTVPAPLDLKALNGGGGISNPLGLTIRSGTFAGTITGAGGLAIPAGATVMLTGDSTYAGATSITGTLNLGDGTTSGSLPGASPITFNGGGTPYAPAPPILNVNRSDTYVMPNNWTGGGSLIMLGSGELRLTGSSTRDSAATIAKSGVITVANPAFCQGGGGVTNTMSIDGGRMHFTEDTPDVRLFQKGATGRMTVASGKTINVIAFQVADMTGAYTFGDPSSGGTVSLAPFALGYTTNFTTDFTVEGGIVRMANTNMQDPTPYFRTTTVTSPGVLEAGAVSFFRNLRGDGTVRATSSIVVSGPTDFSGRLEGAGNIQFVQNGIYRGDGSAYTGQLIVDAQVRLAGGAILGPGPVTVNQQLFLDRTDTYALGNVFAGGGSITKNGGGTLTLSGASPSFTGGITVAAGELAVTGSVPATVTNNARLSGTGTVGNVNTTGTVAPGASPGVLNTGSYTQGGGSLAVEIVSPVSGSGYDQLNVTGGVSLGGTLGVTLGYAPAAGDTFRIVSNDGNDAVAGTFAGLPEGGTLTVGTAKLTISYAGGDGNDVVLSYAGERNQSTGASPTGTGTVGATFTGGGPTCLFAASTRPIPLTGDARSPADAAPEGFDFPHGLFDMTLSACTPGSTVTMVLTYPAPLPPGTVYYKYGPTTADPTPHWYVFPATISGNTITLVLTDGADGDDDRAANGSILDPGGPAVPKPPVVVQASPPPPKDAYQALWWAGSPESGWGVHTAHQGNTLFATWFTYDANGNGQWFVMSNAELTAPGTFKGRIYVTNGPAFSAVPFDPSKVTRTDVGEGTFTFASVKKGTFEYTVNGVHQVKEMSRYEFGDVIPECTGGGEMPAVVNYQDLWWNPSESGWGLTIAHQGDVMFVAWFTYDAKGNGQWLMMPDLRRVGLSDTFRGTIYRARGNVFSAVPWDPKSVLSVAAGTATLAFHNAREADFLYTLDGISQVKRVERYEYATPKAVCRNP